MFVKHADVRSPLRDMVVGKIWGERKKYFSNVLRSLTKLLCSLEKFCVLSQNFCILSQRYLRSLTKRLRSLAKPVEFGLFTLQLAVVHTALYVHNGAVHRVLF